MTWQNPFDSTNNNIECECECIFVSKLGLPYKWQTFIVTCILWKGFFSSKEKIPFAPYIGASC